MANIYFILLGCDKNTIDAEIMARRLTDGGHVIVNSAAEADCAIVNTCGFIDSAKEEAIENIFDMVREKEHGNVKAVVVTGCLAQRYRDEIQARIPEVDAVAGIAHNEDICGVVAQALGGERFSRFGEPEALKISGARILSTPPHYAYIKIAEGCSHHCTFCAIPSIRGKYRSRPQDEIIDEAKALVLQGVRELIVIAQDTTSYGDDLEPSANLAGLLNMLCEIDGVWKIRLLYAYPDRIDDELIAAMAAQPKIAKYVDIPMQHANIDILRKMGRFGDSEQFLSLLEKLRGAMPDITIRSTFIVGFPGETEDQFLELIDFIKEARLDRAGCFAYSAEESTPAEKLPGQLDDETKSRRAEQFVLVQSDIMTHKRENIIGREFEVICDGYDADIGYFACRGEADVPGIDTCVYLPLEFDLVPGELYMVKVTETDGVDLYAELV